MLKKFILGLISLGCICLTACNFNVNINDMMTDNSVPSIEDIVLDKDLPLTDTDKNTDNDNGNDNDNLVDDDDGNDIVSNEEGDKPTLYKETKYLYTGEVAGYNEYNEKGLMTVSKSVDYVNFEVYWFEWEYDSNGNCIKYNEYDTADGSLLHCTEFEYDDAGNQIGNITYDSDGNIENSYACEYDNHNSLI